MSRETTPMKATRINHSNKGRALESAVLASTGNLLTLDRHGQESKRIGGGFLVAKKGPVDFTGTVNATGRSIRFDAKRCDLVTRFPIGNRDHFPEHQRQHLIRHGKAGAIAGLLVEATALGRFLWMDWSAIETTREPSVPWSTGWFWHDLGPTTHAIQFDRIPGVLPLMRGEPAPYPLDDNVVPAPARRRGKGEA